MVRSFRDMHGALSAYGLVDTLMEAPASYPPTLWLNPLRAAIRAAFPPPRRERPLVPDSAVRAARRRHTDTLSEVYRELTVYGEYAKQTGVSDPDGSLQFGPEKQPSGSL